MSSINGIASASVGISMNNAKTDISLSVLKKAMNQSEDDMMKLMQMPTSPEQMVSSNKIDVQI